LSIAEDLPAPGVREAKLQAACGSGGLASAADQVWQIGNERLPRHIEPTGQIVPECDGVLGPDLGTKVPK
jgi:hypothetical protein